LTKTGQTAYEINLENLSPSKLTKMLAAGYFIYNEVSNLRKEYIPTSWKTCAQVVRFSPRDKKALGLLLTSGKSSTIDPFSNCDSRFCKYLHLSRSEIEPVFCLIKQHKIKLISF